MNKDHKMKNMRNWSVLFLLAALLPTLLACNSESRKTPANPAAEKTTATAANTSEKQILHITRNIGGREGFRRHFQSWKQAIEAKNPGWEVQLVDLGNADGATYYKSRMATNSLPDVAMTWALAGLLADGKALVPLPDDYYAKFGIDLPPLYKGGRYTTGGGTQINGIVINKKMWQTGRHHRATAHLGRIHGRASKAQGRRLQAPLLWRPRMVRRHPSILRGQYVSV